MKNLVRISVLIAAVNFAGSIAFGQNQWTRQSPLPAARNLTGVSWATSTHAFASGEYGTFIETSDGGATWHTISLDIFPTDPFYNVYCRDAANCFVIGNSGTNGPDHWRTTDSGATWQRITSFPVGGSWRQIDFVSATVGFMGSNGSTARTTDGGTSWTVMSDYTTCPVIYGMDFRDTQVGLAGGNRVNNPDSGPGIFKTIDAGVTWVRKFSQSANDVLWLSDTTAIAIVGASIYRSTDAGETWLPISSQISTGFDEMALLPNGVIVGVSGAGDAWRSADGGFTWTRTLVGLGDLPATWNVSFFDNQLGTIVGQGGFIFQTTDGGLTWAMLNNGIGGVTFNDLEMFDDSTGLAVGDNGYVLRTLNGGNRWDTDRLTVTGVTLFRNESLQAVSVVDDNFAVAAGYDGVVYKTFDRGATWQSIGYPNLPGEFFISDVKFIDRNLGYVTGNRPGDPQGLFRTTDGGGTWTVLNLNLGHSIDFIDANRGWVIDVGGLGYRTTDGGATWQQMVLPNQGFNSTISKIDFINENEGWAVGWYGYAAHTIDGGRTWQLQNIATQEEHILGLHVLSETEAFAVGAATGASASLFHTNDAGATWTRRPLPNAYTLSSIFARVSRKIWTSGYDGAVLHNPNFTAPAPALLLTFNPTRVIGGNSSQGTIRINNPAPAGGATVTLSSGNPLVSVPASVTVPAGMTSAAFTATTQPINPNDSSPRVTITATYNGNSDTADLVLAPPVVCNFSISPLNEYFGATGGQVVVHVTASEGCNWTADTNRSWITFPDGNSGTGNGRVTVAVAPETNGLTRFGTATIAGQTFGVDQAPAGGCVYSLSSSAQTFDAIGGSGNVVINLTGNCFNGWIARSNENWITVAPPSGSATATISFTVASNTTGASRTGTFTVSGRVFTITQTALAPTPTPAPTSTPGSTPSPTTTPTPAPTPAPTTTPTATATPMATPSPTPTSTPTATASATPTVPPSATPPPTPSPTPTSTPTATPAGSPSATASPSPTSSPSATPSPTPTPSPTVTVTPTATPTPAQALNISTRMRVETGNNVVINGFIINGNAPKNVAVRGIGPSLTGLGISNALADPTLELRSNTSVIFQNDDWQDNSGHAAQLAALGLAPGHPKESGLAATLQPGAYTAILAGKNQGAGVGLVEIYDTNGAADSQLANISTRGFVRTADNVMIGGFILGGNPNNARVVLRGIGPSLAQFGLNPVLADPTLELHDSNGAILVANDNWQDDPASATQLSATGFALSDQKESGIFTSLPAGQFTAILAGKDGGIGIGLVEIYNLR